MSIDERIAQLVRDAVGPMLDRRLDDLEQRLVARLTEPPAKAPEVGPALLTQKEVATRLKVDPRTVARMVERGDFPRPIQITPGRRRWRPRDLDEWIDQRRPL